MSAAARLSGGRLRHLADLHVALILRDLKSRYRDTWLGLAWTLVNPLLYAGVLVFLVQEVLEIRMPRFSSFVLVGVLAYAWFRGALSQGTRSLTGARELVRRPGFRAEVLPTVAVSSNLINFLLALPIMAIVLALGGTPLSANLLWLPFVLAVQYLFVLAACYLLGALNVVFRDTGQLVDLALGVGFFLTPIFYERRSLPAELEWIYDFNPMVPLLDAYREILIHARPPDVGPLLWLAAIGLVLLPAGYRAYRRAAARYVEEL